MNLDAILDELAERVAAKVVVKLSAPTSHYGTGKGATLPPGKSRSWALRNLKLIPGARKVGRDWIVAVTDFDAWVATCDSARLRSTSGRARAANDVPDVEALANQALSESGFRRTRPTRL